MIRVILACCVIAVALRAGMTAAVRQWGISYESFTLVYVIAYAAIGFIAQRVTGRFGRALLVLVCAGLAEATAGLWAARLIDPRSVGQDNAAWVVFGSVYTIVFVTFFGSLGVFVGSLARKTRSQ